MGILEDIEAGLHAVEATAEQVAAYVGRLGDFGTAGPDVHPDDGVEAEHAPHPAFEDGWWIGATKTPAHPHRVGGPIDAVVVVDHTTDMHRANLRALIKKWCDEPGDGAGAHFLVAPTLADGGVFQFCQITKNGNHVGGKTPPNGHGWFHDPARPGANIHPNLAAIGIEFMCAGGQVRLIGGVWRFWEDGVVSGPPIPDENIWQDPNRPGRGVEILTDYQQQVRAQLHGDLDGVLSPLPAGYRAVSTGEAVAAWATPKTQRFLGHYNLDPTNRADPWRPNYGLLLP